MYNQVSDFFNNNKNAFVSCSQYSCKPMKCDSVASELMSGACLELMHTIYHFLVNAPCLF